jgi:hypothetical protein
LSLHTRLPPNTKHTAGIAIASAGILAIAVLTLIPTDGAANIPFWCITCGDKAAVDLILNIPLFIPLGFGLGFAGLDRRRTMLLAVALTLTVEALQFTVIAGRYASVRDLMTNVLGAWLGWLLARHWRSFVLPEPRIARMLVACSACVWVGTQAGTAWMLASDPHPPPWWAQVIPHHFRFPAIFRGDIVAMSLGRRAILESDQLQDADQLRSDLIRGASLLSVVTNVTPTPGLAPILAISAGEHEAALLAQTGRDGVFRIRVRGVGAGFRPPSVRIPHAFAGARADTFSIAGAYFGGRYRLEAVRAGELLHRDLAASPSWGWAFLLPFSNYSFGPEVFPLTALWLVGWLGLIGFWAGRARATRARAGALAAGVALLLAVGLGAVPLVAGIPVAHWSEWGAGVVGTGLGWAVSRGRRLGAPSDSAR